MGAIAHTRWFDARSGREGVEPSRPLPVFTVLLCLAAIAVYAAGQGGAWEWSREALARGEVWRVFTGHVAHWSLEHLAWDVGALALLGVWLERRGRARFVSLVAGAAAAISIGLGWLDPGLAAYRGLSGVDSTLFVAVCAELLRDALAGRDRRGAVAAGMLLVGFVAKVGAEALTGVSLFVSNAVGPSGAEVTPLAHAIGCGVALVFAALSLARRRTIAALAERVRF